MTGPHSRTTAKSQESPRTEAQLEAAADRLLREAGKDPEYPTLTRGTLAEHERRDREAAYQANERLRRREGSSVSSAGIIPTQSELGSIPGFDDLLTTAWREICAAGRSAGIRKRALSMLDMARRGYTHAEIAEEFSVTRQAVGDCLARTCERIRALPAFGTWSVIADAFGLGIGEVSVVCRRTYRRREGRR